MQATLLCGQEPAVEIFLDQHVMELESTQAERSDPQHTLFLDQVMPLFKIMGERLKGFGPFEPQHVRHNFSSKPCPFHTGHIQQFPVQRSHSRESLLDDGLYARWRRHRRGWPVFHPKTANI